MKKEEQNSKQLKIAMKKKKFGKIKKKRVGRGESQP